MTLAPLTGAGVPGNIEDDLEGPDIGAYLGWAGHQRGVKKADALPHRVSRIELPCLKGGDVISHSVVHQLLVRKLVFESAAAHCLV